jgi:glycosyltransferase involved in cell wall biosynthesis
MIDRVFTILQVLPKLDTGGAERVAIEIAEAVVAAGHKSIIAAEPGPLLSAAQRSGAEIVHLPLASKSPFTMRRNAKRLETLIRAQKLDLVHAHSRAPAWSARWAVDRTKTPFVTSYHGVYAETSALKRRYNAVMAGGDRVIAVSAFIAGLVRARYAVGDDRLRTILGGVDVQKFDPGLVVGDRVSRLAREWRMNMSEPAIMLPGRLTGWKGQKLLIQALGRMRHQEAVVILAGAAQGRENYVQNLVSLAEGLGLAGRVRLVGNAEDMPAAMMLVDIVVNASTDPEAFGRTIIEAQAMGRVVVAADHGGARETILPGETGFLFPPGDASALAAVLDAALEMSPQARIAWGQRARAHVAQAHSLAAMQAATLGVYGELLG